MQLPHFSHISAKCAYRTFFPHKLSFLVAILIFFVFILPNSIRFRYLDHLVANRMAQSTCPDPCGTRWGSSFQAFLYHISAYICLMFGLYAVCTFFKCCIKLTCLIVVSERADFTVSDFRLICKLTSRRVNFSCWRVGDLSMKQHVAAGAL